MDKFKNTRNRVRSGFGKVFVKKRTWISVAMTLGLTCAVLFGCKKNVGTPEDNAIVEDDGEERPEREGYLFAYCCVNSEDPYFQAVEKSIRVSLQKEDAELLVMDAKGDVALQSRQIQELIDERVDAVFLTPVDGGDVTEMLEALEAAQIPVVNLDIRVKEAGLVDAYVGSDNRNAGYACGEDLIVKCPDGGKILIMENPAISSLNERITGFERSIANKGFEVLARAQVSGDREAAKSQMKEFLEKYPQIDAVMCASDQIALGVLDAVKKSEREDFRIYSVGGSPQIKAEIAKEDSVMCGTGAQSPIKVGEAAVEACMAVLKGEEHQSEVLAETVFNNRENVELYGTNGWQ